MKQSIILNEMAIILIIICLSINSNGQDWPQWRGPDRDAHVKNFKSPEKWPDLLKQEWKKPVGLGDASPVLAGNKLYLITKQENNEVAICLDAKNGEIIWSTILNASPEVTGGARTHPGPRSTPTVALGKVYTLGVGGNLNCLDVKTGKVIWKNESFPEIPQFFTSASSLVTEGLCITHLGGKENGCIVAFKANTGEIAWKLEKEPTTYSSPVLMKSGKEEIVVIQTETHLLGITLKGELLWKYATPGEQRFYNSTTPVIEGQTIFIVGQGKGTTKLVASKTGKSWNISETWRNPDLGGSFNTPVLKNGYLYGNEARLGKLYCINASTGVTAWADTVGYNRFAATFDLGEIMLSQPASGKLIFYDANPQKYISKAIYKASDTEIYAHPLVTGNKIYIKDKENLTCFSL